MAVDNEIAELVGGRRRSGGALDAPANQFGAAVVGYQQRQPHALMSFSRMARLLEIGINFGKLAHGLDSPNPLPEKLVYDYELTGLKRAYGTGSEIPAIAASVPVTSTSASSLTVAPRGPIVPASQPAPPVGTGSAHSVTGNSEPAPAAGAPPVPPRCDAWGRWARNLRWMKS